MAEGGTVRVWDLPTRLFHWSLVALLTFSWWSAENREMEWHLLSGIVLVAMLVFRLIWGFVGGSTARFAAFVRSPGKVLDYLRGRHAVAAGHNPLGGYSALALLALLVLQVVSGLFATDVDGLDSGPLSYLVDFDQSRVAAEWHELSFNVLLALVGLHVLAVAFYMVVRRRNLIVPMITGRARDAEGSDGALVPARPIWLVLAMAVAAGVAWWVNTGLAT